LMSMTAPGVAGAVVVMGPPDQGGGGNENYPLCQEDL